MCAAKSLEKNILNWAHSLRAFERLIPLSPLSSRLALLLPLVLTANTLAGCSGGGGSDGIGGGYSYGGGIQGTNTSERTISGTIIDENGSPVSGALVSVLQSGDSIQTDLNGFYSLVVALQDGDIELLIESDKFNGSILIQSLASNDKRVQVDVAPDGKGGVQATVSVSSEPAKGVDLVVLDPALESGTSAAEPSISRPRDPSLDWTGARKQYCTAKYRPKYNDYKIICRRPPPTPTNNEGSGGSSGSGSESGGGIIPTPTPTITPTPTPSESGSPTILGGGPSSGGSASSGSGSSSGIDEPGMLEPVVRK